MFSIVLFAVFRVTLVLGTVTMNSRSFPRCFSHLDLGKFEFQNVCFHVRSSSRFIFMSILSYLLEVKFFIEVLAKGCRPLASGFY